MGFHLVKWMNESRKGFHAYGIFVWCLAILFYLYEFFLRVIPATVSKDIIIDLDITLAQFSLISSAYYITYALMQIPVGILTDRFGPRVLATSACIACTVGLIGFAYSDNFYNAIISRLIIGFGSSFGYVTLLVVALNWFPRKHFGFLSGLGQALGALGPLMAGAPAIFLLDEAYDNLRILFLWISIYGAILSVLMGIFIRNQPAHVEGEVIYLQKERKVLHDLKMIMKMPQVWFTMIYTGSVYVSLPMLGAYYGTIYLDARGFSKATAGFLVSMIWVGLAIGCPILGKLSDYIQRRKPILTLACLLGGLASIGLLFLPTQNEWILGFFLILIGVSGAGQALSFALITEHVATEIKATAVGANNTANMLFASIIPPVASLFIHVTGGSKEIYTPESFIKGLSLMPIAYALSLVVSIFLLKETFCKPQQSIHHIE